MPPSSNKLLFILQSPAQVLPLLQISLPCPDLTFVVRFRNFCLNIFYHSLLQHVSHQEWAPHKAGAGSHFTACRFQSWHSTEYSRVGWTLEMERQGQQGDSVELNKFFFFLFFLMALQGFWDLSCQLEIEPRPSAVRLWGPNLQTTREVPEQLLKSFQCGSEVAAMSLAGPLLFRHWENSGCIKSELPRMFSCPLEFRGSMGLGLYKMK